MPGFVSSDESDGEDRTPKTSTDSSNGGRRDFAGSLRVPGVTRQRTIGRKDGVNMQGGAETRRKKLSDRMRPHTSLLNPSPSTPANLSDVANSAAAAGPAGGAGRHSAGAMDASDELESTLQRASVSVSAAHSLNRNNTIRGATRDSTRRSKRRQLPEIELGPAPDGLNKDQRKRRHIVAELLLTEKNYVAYLNRIKALRAKAEEHNGTRALAEWMDIEHILSLHSQDFARELDHVMSNWDSSERIGASISGVFHRETTRTVYRGYVHGSSEFQSKLKYLKATSSKISRFLADVENGEEDHLSLESLLMKPVTRVPHLILLLQRLLGCCPVGHADRVSLQQAIMHLEDLASDLNAAKGERDRRNELDILLDTVQCHPSLVDEAHKLRSLKEKDSATKMEEFVRQDEVRYSDVHSDKRAAEATFVLLDDELCILDHTKKVVDGKRIKNFICAVSTSSVTIMGAEQVLKAELPISAPKILLEELEMCKNDEKILTRIKKDLELLSKDYRALSSDNVNEALKEQAEVLRDINQSIKAAGSSELYLSIAWNNDADGGVHPANGRHAKRSLYRVVFPNKDDTESWICSFRTISALDSPLNNVLEGRKGPWVRDINDTHQPSLLPLSQGHSLQSLVPSDGPDRFTDMEPVCAVTLTFAPKTCAKPARTWSELSVSQGAVWTILSDDTQFVISVLCVCNSGGTHLVDTLPGMKTRAYCATAVPGIQMNEDFSKWADEKYGGMSEESVRAKPINFPSVWIGTESMGIGVYKVSRKSATGKRIFHIKTDGVPVRCIKYRDGLVLAGMEDGALLVYRRLDKGELMGVWNRAASRLQLTETNVGAVTCLAIPGSDTGSGSSGGGGGVDVVWCAIRDTIFVASLRENTVMGKIEMDNGSHVIRAMECVGCCVLVAMLHCRHLSVYHWETHEKLSEQGLEKVLAFNNRLSSQSPGEHAATGAAAGTGSRSSRRRAALPHGGEGAPAVSHVVTELRAQAANDVRRNSLFAADFHPTALAIHAGNLWVGTSTGHLVHFTTSRLGAIPNVRRGRLCAFKHGGEVQQIVLTGVSHHTPDIEIALSTTGGNTRRAESVAPPSRPLNHRKMSIAESQESMRGRSESTLYLHTAEEEADANGATAGGAGGDSELGSDSFNKSSGSDDRATFGTINDVFPVLTSKSGDRRQASARTDFTFAISIGPGCEPLARHSIQPVPHTPTYLAFQVKN